MSLINWCTNNTTFSFDNDNIIEFEIHDGVFARLKRTSCAVAVLTFIKDGVEAPIPPDFNIFDDKHNEIVKPHREYYALCWTDPYILKWNGNSVTFTTERRWFVQSAKELSLNVIES